MITEKDFSVPTPPDPENLAVKDAAPPPLALPKMETQIILDRGEQRFAKRIISRPFIPLRRKKPSEEPENHERWLVSYADFITLLFAFFVVMYAISSVNDGKYRALSNSMDAAFHVEQRSPEPIQIGEPARSPQPIKFDQAQIPSPANSANKVSGQQVLDVISNEINDTLSGLISKDLVGVRRGKFALEIEIKTSLLFPSGSSALEPNAWPILAEVAEILKKFPNQIQVGGFTDDRPISSVIYPSNWELSAGRAASVVHLFNKLGVNPERMSAVGYGEYRPTADNSTIEGRNKNRRVVLHILAQAEAQNETSPPRAP